MTTRHDFGGVLDGLWTLLFGLSQFHGHNSWLMCKLALSGYWANLIRTFHMLVKQPYKTKGDKDISHLFTISNPTSYFHYDCITIQN
jgi:hypothetical protein